MKLDVFCAWGDGPDVGINITRTQQEVDVYMDPLFVPLDFTAAEARELARKLIECAEAAEALDKSAEEYFTLEKNAPYVYKSAAEYFAANKNEYCAHMLGAEGSCARCEGT